MDAEGLSPVYLVPGHGFESPDKAKITPEDKKEGKDNVTDTFPGKVNVLKAIHFQFTGKSQAITPKPMTIGRMIFRIKLFCRAVFERQNATVFTHLRAIRRLYLSSTSSAIFSHERAIVLEAFLPTMEIKLLSCDKNRIFQLTLPVSFQLKINSHYQE